MAFRRLEIGFLWVKQIMNPLITSSKQLYHFAHFIWSSASTSILRLLGRIMSLCFGVRAKKQGIDSMYIELQEFV